MKYTFIQNNEGWINIGIACTLFNVSRSSYYEWKSTTNKRAARKTVLDKLVTQIKEEHRKSRGTYGSLKITKASRKRGINVNHKTVAKLMRLNGIKSSVRTKFNPQTTDSNHDKPIYDNLLKREFVVPHENYAWCSDITYIRTDEGWLYLATVMDLFANKIIGFATSANIDKNLVVKALSDALKARGYPRGVIVHTDRGSQYCSKVYRQLIKQNGLRGSMSRRANCWDNAVAENFFGLIKKEVINHLHFKTRSSAELVIFDYINGWYNPHRIHSKLGYLSPNEFEAVNKKQANSTLNHDDCCKKSQLFTKLTNQGAAMS